MKRIAFIFFLTSKLFGQDVDFQKADYKVNGGQTNIYTDAIARYIDSIYFTDKPTLDTLFILKNPELTANIFPNKISQVNICFQDTVILYRQLKNNRSLRALNIFSDQTLGKDRVNISIFSFLISLENKGKPTRGCRISYYYNHSKKEFEFKNIACDY